MATTIDGGSKWILDITILVVKSSSTQHLQRANIIKGRGQREMAGVCQDTVADGAEVAAVSTPYSYLRYSRLQNNRILRTSRTSVDPLPKFI